MVRLQPGGVVGDDGVGRGVGLVEAVLGELADQLVVVVVVLVSSP